MHGDLLLRAYRACVGASVSPSWLQSDWLLRQFADNRNRAIARYQDFVRAGIGLASVWDDLQHQIYLGDGEFVRKLQAEISADLANHREIPKSQRRVAGKPIQHYVENYSDAGSGIYEAYKTGDFTQQQIADAFGVHYSTVSRAIKRCKMNECKT